MENALRAFTKCRYSPKYVQIVEPYAASLHFGATVCI